MVKKIKGGVKVMEVKMDKIYKEKCKYCDREFRAFNENQAKTYKLQHELFCKTKDKKNKPKAMILNN